MQPVTVECLLLPERLKRRGRHRRSTVAQVHGSLPSRPEEQSQRSLYRSLVEEEVGPFVRMLSERAAVPQIGPARSPQLLANLGQHRVVDLIRGQRSERPILDAVH